MDQSTEVLFKFSTMKFFSIKFQVLPIISKSQVLETATENPTSNIFLDLISYIFSFLGKIYLNFL